MEENGGKAGGKVGVKSVGIVGERLWGKNEGKWWHSGGKWGKVVG